MQLPLLRALNQARGARKAAILVTDTATGAERLVLEEAASADELGPELEVRFRSGRSGMLADGRTFLTVHLPPPRLAVIGAVHISQALAPMARLAGFDVTIIDPRTAFATPERFPDVRLLAEWPEDALGREPLDRYTALVALTHDPKIDDQPLRAALEACCFYVGALGSRKTHAKRLERLREAGVDAAALERIHAPVGLDIGAQSPAEIAVAVLAEVIAALRRGGPVERTSLAGKETRNGPAKERDGTVAAVVLAAGQSRRMGGGNKLLASFGGVPLVRRSVQAAIASQASPVIVVTGHMEAEIRAALAGLDVVFAHNALYPEGLATSLKTGLATLPGDSSGALVLLADMPAISTEIIDRLVAEFLRREGPAIVVPTVSGKRGNPVLWSHHFFPELLTVAGDSGARHLIGFHPDAVVPVEIGPAAAADVDTPEALVAAGGIPARDDPSQESGRNT